MKNIYHKFCDLVLRYRTNLMIAGFTAVVILVFLWPRIFVSVYAGELGVLYSRFFGGTILDRVYQEGLHFITPWDTLASVAGSLFPFRFQQNRYGGQGRELVASEGSAGLP